MITVTMLVKEGHTVGFTCAGHANHGEVGNDIVCSAVSALTQTCLIGLTEVIGIQAGISVDEADGIRCILDTDTVGAQAEQAELLFQTMAAGLNAIDKAYPKTLKIRNREV